MTEKVANRRGQAEAWINCVNSLCDNPPFLASIPDKMYAELRSIQVSLKAMREIMKDEAYVESCIRE